MYNSSIRTIVTRTGEICRKSEKGEVQWLCYRVMLQIQFLSDPDPEVQRKEMLQINRNETKKAKLKILCNKKFGRGKDGWLVTSS